MTSAVIYIRVSTTEQVDNYSLATQERECRAYCQRQGLEIDSIFREEGESAKSANRPEFQRMLTYCIANVKQQDIGAVVVSRFDRFARSTADHTRVRASLLEHGVRLRSVAEPFDDTPAGLLQENMMASFAQYDNDLRSQNTKRGMMEAARRGRWVWQAPLGYLQAPREAQMSMILDPESAPFIRLGFEAIATRGLTKADALGELTDLGLLTRKGKRLTKQSFSNMLIKPIYMGRVVIPEWAIDVDGDFEPVVSAEIFDAAQRVMFGRSPTKSRHMRDNPDFPLRRIVQCGRCQSPLTGSWSTGRQGRYPYYRCPKKGCKGSGVRKERLEELLRFQLGEATPNPAVVELLGVVVEDAWGERSRVAMSSQRSIAKCLVELGRKKDRLVDTYISGRGITQATFESQLKRLEGEEAELQHRYHLAHPGGVDLTCAISLATTMFCDLPGCWNRLDPQHRSQFLGALYPSGLVYEDGILGTTNRPWWMGISGGQTADSDDLVRPPGLEPGTDGLRVRSSNQLS